MRRLPMFVIIFTCFNPLYLLYYTVVK